DRVLRLDGGERVAGVDRTHEAVRALDRADIRNLLHVEQRRNARHHVLPVRRGRGEEVRVPLRQSDHQGGDVFGEKFGQMRRIRVQYFLYAGDLRRRLRRLARLVACDEDMDLGAELLCRGDRVQRRLLDRAVVVLGDDENAHNTFASLRSLSSSALASPTFMPALRFGGSATLSVARRGATSTPSASGFSVSSVFFFAFMMFGSVT